mgnify:CR=1 FL=1
MHDTVNIALVNVNGDLDVTTVGSVRRRIDALVAQGCRRIFLNMAGSTRVDSAGMGLILSELRRMRRLGGLLSLSNVSPSVYLALCRMRMVDYLLVSRAGARLEVDELDPSVLPCWRTTFRVDATALGGARDRVSELLGGLPLTPDEVFDMTLASGEAVGNAVDHTCEGGVLVTVAAYADRAVVDVADCGCGFAPAQEGGDPVEPSPWAERGRGIRLMRLLADSVIISSKSAGQGTVVRLVKLFDGPGAVTVPEQVTPATRP